MGCWSHRARSSLGLFQGQRLPGSRRLVRKKHVGVGLSISILWNKIMAEKQNFVVNVINLEEMRAINFFRSMPELSVLNNGTYHDGTPEPCQESQKQNNNKQGDCDFCARS